MSEEEIIDVLTLIKLDKQSKKIESHYVDLWKKLNGIDTNIALLRQSITFLTQELTELRRRN